MNYDISHVENFFEESSALYEYYLERVFESESVNDLSVHLTGMLMLLSVYYLTLNNVNLISL